MTGRFGSCDQRSRLKCALDNTSPHEPRLVAHSAQGGHSNQNTLNALDVPINMKLPEEALRS
jgi:hypothetical protein